MTTPLGSSTTGATTGTGTATAPKAKAAGESAMGPDAFMKLLVAQLKYQNPMAPADGQAYMTQMATFTQVEKLDALVKAQAAAATWQQRVSAEGMVGRSVSGSKDGVVTAGTVVGVRYSEGTSVLQLSDGRTLDVGSVDHVSAVPAAAPAGTATPPGSGSGTAGTGTSTTGTTAPDTTGTPGTTAAPAAAPST